jgi:hypothetical protein
VTAVVDDVEDGRRSAVLPGSSTDLGGDAYLSRIGERFEAAAFIGDDPILEAVERDHRHRWAIAGFVVLDTGDTGDRRDAVAEAAREQRRHLCTVGHADREHPGRVDHRVASRWSRSSPMKTTS